MAKKPGTEAMDPTAALERSGRTAYRTYEALEREAADLQRLSVEEPRAAEWRRRELRRSIVLRQIELFRAEHDNTGAWKLKQFERVMEQFLTGKPPVIERDAAGRFALAQGEQNRRLMVVDMLELDRINQEGGGHDAGDIALRRTVEVIEAQLARHLAGRKGKTGSYEIYRSGGNQIMVSFEDVDPETVWEIRQAIAHTRADISDEIGKPVEPAPLSAGVVDLEDVIEDVNHLQSRLEQEAGDEIATSEDAAREIMEVALRSAEWGSEMGKFTARAHRVKEKLDAGDPQVEPYFKEYVAKAFEGTKFAKLSAIRDTIEAGTFDFDAYQSAIKAANAHFTIDRSMEEKGFHGMDAMARKAVIQERLVARRKEAKKAESRKPESEAFAEPPTMTEGEKVLAERKALIDAAVRDLADARDRGESGESLEELETGVELAELDYKIETARRNRGTGLLERGPYFARLEDAIQRGEDVSTVFIDMGFLKYFDKKGGADVGNAALRVAADRIERAIAAAGIRGTAYRYGGDELTVIVEGDAAAAAKFNRALAVINEKEGKIGPGKNSQPEYVPTGLQFNVGSADSAMLRKILEESGRGGADLNKKAEIMTKIADVGVEYNKAIARFEYLIDELSDPAYEEKAAGSKDAGIHTKQAESKLMFSRKAIFAKFGGEVALRAFADELRHLSRLPEKEREGLREEIEEQVRRFVIDRVEASHAQAGARKELLDQLLEARAKINFLQDRLTEYADAAGRKDARLASLERELASAKDDLKKIIQTRGGMQG